MNDIHPEYGTTADGLLAVRIGDVGYIAVPARGGLRLASVWRSTQPIVTWSREDVFTSQGIVPDEAGFRAHVDEVALHLRQRQALGRKRTSAPVSTPWGASQEATIYAEGIVSHSTASHGGIKLDRARNAAMHPALRVPGGWYEEDGEWAKVAVGYPALFTDRERALADRTLRDWYPEAWEAVHGRLLMPEESLARDRERFDREHADDWVVIAAVRSNRHPDMVQITASLGGHRREGCRRHFLVPASDYRVGRHGFVIELANHIEIVAA